MRNSILLLVVILLTGHLVLSQSVVYDSDSLNLDISKATKKDIYQARFYAKIHNEILGCALDNLKENELEYSRENMKSELSDCFKNNFFNYFIFNDDSIENSEFSKINDFLDNFSTERIEELATMAPSVEHDSIRNEILPQGKFQPYEEELNSIDTSYFKKNYQVDDTTFIINAHESLFLKVDRDNSLTERERFFIIYNIVIHKYDLLLWTHYKEFRYQFRYEN